MPRGVAARAHVTGRLMPGATVALSSAQAHHFGHVLRLAAGAAIAAFNQGDGEWLCHIDHIGRGDAVVRVERLLRSPEPEAELWLLFAPVRRARLDWLVEKASELGVALLWPVWTARTQSERLNLDRLRAHAVAAAEQSGRLSVPELRPPARLDAVLKRWPAGRHLAVCDETGIGEPVAAAATRLAGEKLALLVGPEGGFAETELDHLGKLAFVSRIGLGPRVLRAETAALAALAVVQAIAGDGCRPRGG
jgi:16S rRNA (uracil1498-N3)-methyltransferase